MSATAIQVSKQTGISEKEWVKLFPKQVTENYTSSITFIKQLTVVAVSTITYLKNAFPEESYYNETFAGLNLKMLKDKCGDELAQFVSSSLKQAFDAFDKKYVHQLALCFYSGDCIAENLMEYHVFEYSYNRDGISLNINSKNRNNVKNTMKCSMESVKTRTAMLVRSLSLFVFQNCQAELPVDYDVSLRVYYNEDSPADYQAPGFGPSPEPDHLEASARAAVCLGWVETPYHKLIARTFVRDVPVDSDAAAASDTQPEITQDDNNDFQAAESTKEPGSESSLEQLRCPCNKQDIHDQTLMVTCQYCHTWQHAACFGLISATPDHCCASCAERDPARTSSCSLLEGLDARKQECLCIFRRTLMWCLDVSAVSGAALMARYQLTETSAAKMLRLLQSHFILPIGNSKDLTTTRKINPIRLKLACKKFFRVPQDTADRLMFETEQDEDPIGEVLDPIEKITLHNTSNPGTVVDNVSNNMLEENPPLQDFMEVVLPNENNADELPLSGSHNPVDDVANAGKKLKRKKDEEDDWKPSKLPKLRSGTKSKKKVSNSNA